MWTSAAAGQTRATRGLKYAQTRRVASCVRALRALRWRRRAPGVWMLTNVLLRMVRAGPILCAQTRRVASLVRAVQGSRATRLPDVVTLTSALCQGPATRMLPVKTLMVDMGARAMLGSMETAPSVHSRRSSILLR
eukprot:Rmarinus@m.13755